MRNFGVIVADPPWKFGDGLRAMRSRTRRSAESQYRVMDAFHVMALGHWVRKLSDPSACVLALWVPSTMLSDGLQVVEDWGFSFKQTFVWAKVSKDPLGMDRGFSAQSGVPTNEQIDLMNDSLRMGMGRLFRQSHEVCLIGTRGKEVYRNLSNRSQMSVAFDLNVGHSTKTELLQHRLELMFPSADKLELFARRQRTGWTCLGDAVDGTDIVGSLERLCNEGKDEEEERSPEDS